MVLLFPVSIKRCASTRSIWSSKMAFHHQNGLVPYVLILSRAAVKCQRAVFSLLNRGVWAAGLKSTTGDFSVSQARRLCSCSVDGCLFICVNGFSGCQVLHLKPQKCSGWIRRTGVVMEWWRRRECCHSDAVANDTCVCSCLGPQWLALYVFASMGGNWWAEMGIIHHSWEKFPLFFFDYPRAGWLQTNTNYWSVVFMVR